MNRTLYAAAAATVLITALFAGLAATATPAGADARAVPGAACTTAGATTVIDTRNGSQTYRCEQRSGEDCPHWHWVYNPAAPRGRWTPQPAGPCPTCSTPPASSPPASTPASSTPAPTSSSDAPTLPTTGGRHYRPGLIAAFGIALVLAGAALIVSMVRPDPARHRRRRGAAPAAAPAEETTAGAVRRPSPYPAGGPTP